MTLNELRYIVAVARERHFGRAAESCFVSQPTLSVAIKKLEDELGVPIFERGRTEVSVTPVGERIVEQAQRVLEDAEAIQRIARHGQDPLAGPLRLGAIYTIGPYLFPHLIPLLHKRAPNMPLIIEEDLTANLAEKLRRRELDVIVISLPFEAPGVLTRALYDEPFVVALPAGHPLEKKKTIRAGDLSRETLLLLGAGNCFRDQVLEVCPECRERESAPEGIQRALEGSSLETIRHMVASGAGVTVLPATSVDSRGYPRKLLSIRPFARPVPRRRVALAWRKGFPRAEAVDALARAIRDARMAEVEYLH